MGQQHLNINHERGLWKVEDLSKSRRKCLPFFFGQGALANSNCFALKRTMTRLFYHSFCGFDLVLPPSLASWMRRSSRTCHFSSSSIIILHHHPPQPLPLPFRFDFDHERRFIIWQVLWG